MTDPVSISTTEGSVLFQAGPGSAGRFDLSTGQGQAQFFALTGTVSEVQPGHDRYRGVLNGGENPVTLRSERGMVRVQILPNADSHGPDLWWDRPPGWVTAIGKTLHLPD